MVLPPAMCASDFSRALFLSVPVSAVQSDEFRLRNAGDRPDEADHLACDRSGDYDLRFAGCSETSISRAQPDLRFPGDVSDGRGEGFESVVKFSAHAGRHAIGPGALNQYAARKRVARLGA